MNYYISKLTFIGILLLSFSSVFAQHKGVPSIDSLDKNYLNWFNLSPVADKQQGASVYRAYNDLLKSKTPARKVIVAVIDGGVDINHPDLQGKIWVNSREIAGNKIDDDMNGYVDDVNGWNFIGNAKGENILYENMEYVRLYRALRPKFGKVTDASKVAAADQESYNLYLKCSEKYTAEYTKYSSRKKNIDEFDADLKPKENIIKNHLKKETITIKDLESITSASPTVESARDYLIPIYKKGFSRKELDEYIDYLNGYVNYYLNLDLDSRKIISDNIDDITDNKYGNPDVKGPRSFHGTFVSGIIAANAHNGIGIDGIASNVEIMAIRVVPDGDERDKDVALAIRYAVDNGANIINMSFGKNYATHKQFVDDAVKYAEDHNVLLIHASGNEGADLDTFIHYPTNKLSNGTITQNWVTIGASSKETGKKMCGKFSNYGAKTVDMFAPGVDIISLYPENSYEMGDGTSYACPVVVGVAALVWSYYPQLTAVELKNVLMNSVSKYPKMKVYRPDISSDKQKKVKFGTLSVTGGIVNAYAALLNAENTVKAKPATK